MSRAELEPMSDELREQLSLLENSQGLIRTIFLGIALQYKALEQQKYLLLEGPQGSENRNQPGCTDPKSMQIAASLIVLSALFGFQRQAEDIACQTAQEGICTDWMESKLNATVILVALLRLCRLASPETAAARRTDRTFPEDSEAREEERTAEELEELELLAEPAI